VQTANKSKTSLIYLLQYPQAGKYNKSQ